MGTPDTSKKSGYLKELKEIRLNSMGFTGTPEISRDLQRTYRHPETSRDLKVLPETSRALSKTSM